MEQKHFPRLTSFDDYQQQHARSIAHPDNFWGEIADHFLWTKKWDKVLEWNFDEPRIEWFKGGLLNVCENALDRHLEKRGNKLALIWEPNDVHQRFVRYTYRELYERVCQCANALKELGVVKGDRVCIYMPMIPELIISILACVRIGAVHSVIFSGFSATALADRINDAQAKIIITSDGLNRGAKQIPMKRVVDEALETCTSVDKVIVYNCLEWAAPMKYGRDIWWNDVVDRQPKSCPVEPMDAEDILFVLYTSGSTGKPKGVVHTCAGYMIGVAYMFQNVYQYQESDVFWCSADVGWITGHSYTIYAPLLSGATTVLYEGIPTYPDPGRLWQIIDKHGVNQFLTSPTAIRSLMVYGDEHVMAYSLDSLKILAVMGEPINEEAWKWFHLHVGKGKCTLIDNWWQTETGITTISSIPNVTPVKPMYAGYPMPGVDLLLVDENGTEITENNVEGYLCIKAPWPSMLRTTYGDHKRFKETYFSQYPGYYFSGDGAKRDENGMYRIIGRVDDVINVSGHRFGTAEIENAINLIENVVESAVVGYPHPVKGQAIYAFVICDKFPEDQTHARGELAESVATQIGKIAIPEKIQFVSGLPKTRSGKIMRRILRKIAQGDAASLGDTSTLLNPEVIDELIEGATAIQKTKK